MRPPVPPPPPETKVTIVGKNKIYNRENLVGPFLVHKILGPSPPLPHLLPRRGHLGIVPSGSTQAVALQGRGKKGLRGGRGGCLGPQKEGGGVWKMGSSVRALVQRQSVELKVVRKSGRKGARTESVLNIPFPTPTPPKVSRPLWGSFCGNVRGGTPRPPFRVPLGPFGAA